MTVETGEEYICRWPTGVERKVIVENISAHPSSTRVIVGWVEFDKLHTPVSKTATVSLRWLRAQQ